MFELMRHPIRFDPKPGDYLPSLSVDTLHQLDLLTAFVQVVLINANGIDPYAPGTILTSELAQEEP